MHLRFRSWLSVSGFLVACGSPSQSSGPATPGSGDSGSGSNQADGRSGSDASAGSSSGGSGSPSIDSGAGSTSSGSGGGSTSSGSSSGGSGTDASPPADGASPPSAGTKFVGNITTNGAVRSDFATYWNQITPENEGKWGSVEATQGTFNWTALDAIHTYAQSHGVVFKEHNFIWGSQQPSWIANLSASQQQAAVQAWMQAFCGRYPDTKLIDVVNEPPPHTTPSYANGIGGSGASGYDWIVNAFKWARAACPNAILVLNDYNNIEYSADNSHFIAIVNAIKAAGAPIDAIGAQAHDAYKLSASTVQGFLDKLAATGLPVYITEYDINLADDTQQETVMQTEFPMFWNDSNVKGITLWGYIVGSTWEANTGLMTSSGTMRPAMSWLVDFLKTHP
jgi:endo-1,4-beta-xylanase